MGMDLKPVNASVTPMHNESGELWGRYNIAGWCALQDYLDLKHTQIVLPHFNDGELIPKKTCEKIAEALRFAEDDHNYAWLKDHAAWWRTCGGCYVH